MNRCGFMLRSPRACLSAAPGSSQAAGLAGPREGERRARLTGLAAPLPHPAFVPLTSPHTLTFVTGQCVSLWALAELILTCSFKFFLNVCVCMLSSIFN